MNIDKPVAAGFGAIQKGVKTPGLTFQITKGTTMQRKPGQSICSELEGALEVLALALEADPSPEMEPRFDLIAIKYARKTAQLVAELDSRIKALEKMHDPSFDDRCDGCELSDFGG